MERVKRRKLKFPCLFGVNEETSKGRTIQSWSPSNATTDHSLIKFQVGKSTTKQSNQNRKRPSSILAKLMGKNGISSARPINKQQRIKSKRKEVSEYDIPPKKIILLKPDNTECFSSELELITVPSRVTFGLNDRLTHSLSNISEASLITEAKNKMSEKSKMSVSKECTLGEMLSFSDKHIKHMELDISTSISTSILPSFQDQNHRMSSFHEVDADEKIVVYSEPLNKKERLNENFDHGDDITLKKGRSSKRSLLFQHGTEFGNYITESQSSQKSTQFYIENEGHAIDDGATYAASSVDAVAGYNIEMSLESSQEPLNAKSGGMTPLRLSGPTEDLSSRFNHFERLDAQLQDLKKQLHLLKVESLSTSTHTQIRDQRPSVTASEPVTWESSFAAHILQSSDNYETALDTIHHPRDPRLFYRIEKCFFQGAVLSTSEKHLLYDYIEQTFIKISKSMVADWSVNPKKGESQLMLSELSIEDQVVKVAEQIDKEDTKIFLVNTYNKNPEWLEKNQIHNLGKLLSELVLTDLILEVISA